MSEYDLGYRFGIRVASATALTIAACAFGILAAAGVHDFVIPAAICFVALVIAVGRN